MPEGERKLAAIMFTDMVGYTALGQRNESLSLALVEEQRKVIRPVLVRHNGREVKSIGDAFLVEFPNAIDAVRCAYDIQRAVREFNFSLEPEKRIHLRVGIHVGEVVESQGDISGDAVNVASRIEPLAEDGGVCLTHRVYDLVHTKMDLQLSSMGTRSLKNVTNAMELYRVVMPWEGVTKTTAAITASPLDRKRIAVLPFANMSPDPGDEYFADGMTEELISTMSRISGLRVIARTSVMGYKGENKKIGEVAKELGVGTILEGSVRKAGDRIRITAQLIDSETSEHLWVETYDRELKDVFAIQSEISKTVAESLTVQLLLQEKRIIEKRQRVDPVAYTLYLKGRLSFDERTETGGEKALRFFEQVIEADPKFAPAYSGLADAYGMMADYSWIAPSSAHIRSRELALKALDLDDELAEAHSSLGWALRAHWEFDSAVKEFKRAIELKPNYAIAYHWYSLMMLPLRRYEEEYSLDKKAVELDPFSRSINMGLATSLALIGRTKESMELFRRTITLNPNFAFVHVWKGLVHAWLAEQEAAVEEMKIAFQLDGGPNTELFLAWAYSLGRKKDRALELLEHVLNRAGNEYVSPVWMGIVYLSLGKSDVGFECLERGFAERDSNLLEFRGGPWFKDYHSDPRWTLIDERLGLSKLDIQTG